MARFGAAPQLEVTNCDFKFFLIRLLGSSGILVRPCFFETLALYVYRILSDKYLTLLDPQGPFEDLRSTILGNLPLSSVTKIILFGSIARNTEKFNSDIDLFIQVKNKADKRRVELATERLAALCLESYGNVLSPYVLTAEEFKGKAGLQLIADIKTGIALYPSKSPHES